MQQTLFGASAPRRPVKETPVKSNEELPWVEKYRPRVLNEVCHQTEIVNTLKQCTRQNPPNIPHLLLYGPPGTGKTTTILAIARELFGPEHFNARVKELNASDDRGIAVVRGKIKKFCQLSVTARPYTDANGVRYPVPAFKILILDEADALLHDAQTALRRMMEDYSSSTRFCLICNYVSRIFDPIVSRCAKFRFRPVPKEVVLERLLHVLRSEGLQLVATKEDVPIAPEEWLSELVDITAGDLRLAINYLQSASRVALPGACKEPAGTLAAAKSEAKKQRLASDGSLTPLIVTMTALHDMAGTVPAERIKALFETCSKGHTGAIIECVDTLIADGYAGLQPRPSSRILQVLTGLVPHILQADTSVFSDVAKAAIVQKLSSADRAVCDGSAEHLQLLSLCAFMPTVRGS